MKLENYIESQYRELKTKDLINFEFIALYDGIENATLREILASLHSQFVILFKMMNSRLPTRDHPGHFWAGPSRDLAFAIEIAMGLHRSLKNSNFAFEIDKYYYELLQNCESFLSMSGGSRLPAQMEKVELYYTLPIFLAATSLKMTRDTISFSFPLKLIGHGSYAQIFKYRDENYSKYFAVKRAKENLSPKELERFKREFEEMRSLSSPYILEVFAFDELQHQYTMEFMDFSLDSFIQKWNSKLTQETRKSIALQILKAFRYLHSKKRQHRDISPKNILLREYEDTLVVKISDFGLIKTPDSTLTTVNTEFKGYFNDPALVTEGFDSYGTLHETYALTKLLYYVMTGRTNTSEISDPKLAAFVRRGLNVDKKLRYQTIEEIAAAFKQCYAR
jgi:serine/threonine-protein kinase